MYNLGDIIVMPGTGDFADGVECVVTEITDGRITKAKAIIPDERLSKMGFLIEGEDYIIVEWRWSEN